MLMPHLSLDRCHATRLDVTTGAEPTKKKPCNPYAAPASFQEEAHFTALASQVPIGITTGVTTALALSLHLLVAEVLQ